jgi:BirA family biotin operon repressor/biotin-[acetyl-CoA-carboxylase] ligase
MIGTPEPLPGDLAEGLRRTAARRGAFGDALVFHAEAGSTNDVAARLAEAGAPEGAAVVALAQTAGRGRMGRAWFSPPGAGLYVSVLCRHGALAPYLTLAGGLAVAEGIRAATALPVQIKWPNDVVTAGPGRPRKLAGVLAEASSGTDGVQYVVLGIGINLRTVAYPPALADRATSIETELGRAPDPGAVLGETLAALAAAHAGLEAGHSAGVLARWRALAPGVIGSVVAWDTPEGQRSGTTAGIDDAGALLVRTEAGVERIISGELRWP